MQVRAKRPVTEYDKTQLQQLVDEMDNLLGSMQGFPMRYFREPIVGLNFEFSPERDISVSIDGREQQVKSSFKLTTVELDSLNELRFSQAPTILSPWVK